MPLRNLIVIMLAAVVSLFCYQRAERNRYVAVIGEALHLVDHYYWEEVDRRELFEGAMTGMVTGLDQYSSYIAPDEYRDVETTLDQEFGGVGVEVQKLEEHGPLIVHNTIAGSPAFEARIQPGDAILAIDGTDTRPIALRDSVTLMRGAPGTNVRVRLQRVGAQAPEDLELTRQVVLLDSVLGDLRLPDGSWNYHLEEDPRIGYLRITTFGKHTREELEEILAEMPQPSRPYRALILDLRGNAGGLLDAAVEVCDLFLNEGTIVSTSGRHGHIESSFKARPADTLVPDEVPVAVLVNSLSASASEIVAACLQDHQRAVVIGSRTWGKGTVQNIFELEGGRSALKLTTAGYLRPSGKNIDKPKDGKDEDTWGVLPNDGFQVALNDEETARLFELRRKRDRIPIAGQGKTAAGPTASEPRAPAGTTPDDPQLCRAIDYLTKQLAARS